MSPSYQSKAEALVVIIEHLLVKSLCASDEHRLLRDFYREEEDEKQVVDWEDMPLPARQSHAQWVTVSCLQQANDAVKFNAVYMPSVWIRCFRMSIRRSREKHILEEHERNRKLSNEM